MSLLRYSAVFEAQHGWTLSLEQFMLSCSVSDDDATSAGAGDVVLVPNTRTASTQCVPLDAGHVSVFTISSTDKTPKTWSPSSAAGTLLQAILILTIEIGKKTGTNADAA